MTQAERFVRFVHDASEREMRESSVLLRIENGELVVTRGWRIPGTKESVSNVSLSTSSRGRAIRDSKADNEGRATSHR
jgi:hypothetical protein